MRKSCPEHGAWSVSVERSGGVHVWTECPACTTIKLRRSRATIREVKQRVDAVLRYLEAIEREG